MDGFTSEMNTILIDDLAQENPTKSEGRDLKMLIPFVNNVPYCTPQADLPDKGQHYLKNVCVIATTNMGFKNQGRNINRDDLNAKYYYSAPSAAKRRLKYRIIPRVLPQYRSDPAINSMTDSLNNADLSNGIPNYWTFDLFKVKVIDSYTVEYVPILKDASVQKLCDTIDKLCIDLQSTDKQINSSYSCIKGMKKCELCDQYEHKADCAAVTTIRAPQVLWNPFDFDFQFESDTLVIFSGFSLWKMFFAFQLFRILYMLLTVAYGMFFYPFRHIRKFMMLFQFIHYVTHFQVPPLVSQEQLV
jgi:hypothetical protein